VTFNPDGSILAAAGGDRTLRFFDTSGRRQTRVLRQHADWVQTVAFSKDGRRLVTASRDRTSRVFNVATGEMESTDTSSDVPLLAALFAGETRVLSIDRSRTVKITDFESHQKVAEIKGLDGDPRVALLWDGNIVTAGSSPIITIHQLADRQQLFALAGHRDSVGALALSPDRKILASGSADGEVLFWDLSCGTWLRRFVASPGW
jgi:WD40 repeat protein